MMNFTEYLFGIIFSDFKRTFMIQLNKAPPRNTNNRVFILFLNEKIERYMA